MAGSGQARSRLGEGLEADDAARWWWRHRVENLVAGAV